MPITFLTNEDDKKYIKSINGVEPDPETGDVAITIPDSGGNVEHVGVEPSEDDIPDVHFIVKGSMPFTKAEGDVQVLMRYISKTATIERYCTAKVQGGSSASLADYKKRNWTIKVYKDNTYNSKEKLTFKGWPAMNKFVLKAGWVIPGHLRNVGAAKIWGQIVRSRSDYDSLPEELRNSPNQGATDGFHVRVFINGMYWGIYDWIVAKDQIFGQDKDNMSHSILNSEWNDQPTCAFATTTPTIGGNWSEELLDGMTANTKTSMENWIKFVAGSTDEEFVANAENYFDVQSVIDAICFDRIIMPVDNMCRNQIVFKYDTKWYMGKWDLDAILGLPPVAGQAWYAYDTAYQEGYTANKDYGIINMLYDRTEKLFSTRFKRNYWRLRSGPLSEANLVEVFGRLSDRLRSIEGLLAEENASTTGNGQFTGMPNVSTDTIQQIREMVVKRCAFMDEVIEALIPSVSCTGITLSTSKLTFTSEGSQTLTATVTPDGCTEDIAWESDNPSIATVVNGVVTAVANGSATITAYCGDYSASCSVAVSGIVGSVPCTGIVLDKNQLSFDGEGVQSITATVTPGDTTDTVVWVSSNPNVASITVNGNICTVRSMSSGFATITVTCGNYSAHCAVNVSNLDINVMRGVSWYYGGVSHTNGVIDTNTVLTHSDAFDISAYAGETVICNVISKTVQNGIQRLVFFDEDGSYVSGANGGGNVFTATIPGNAKTARATMHSEGTGFQIMTGSFGETDFASASVTTGKFYAGDGELTDNAGFNCRKFEIEGGKSYYLQNVPSGAFFDANDACVSSVSYHNGDKIVTAPENAKYLGANTGSNATNSNVFVVSEEQIIGESTVTEILS